MVCNIRLDVVSWTDLLPKNNVNYYRIFYKFCWLFVFWRNSMQKKLNSVQEFAKIKSWLLLICLMYRIAEPTLSKVCLMMMMMNCYCGMVDRRKASLISSRDHSQRSSPSRVSDTPRAGFQLAQNLSSGFVEWSCAVVIPTTPRLI